MGVKNILVTRNVREEFVFLIDGLYGFCYSDLL